MIKSVSQRSLAFSRYTERRVRRREPTGNLCRPGRMSSSRILWYGADRWIRPRFLRARIKQKHPPFKRNVLIMSPSGFNNKQDRASPSPSNVALTSSFSALHSCVMRLCVHGSDIPNTELYKITAHDTALPHQLWLLTGPGCFQWSRRASPHFSQISNSVTQICQRQRATGLSKYPAPPRKVTLWGERPGERERDLPFFFEAARNSFVSLSAL